ncbi:hypothetical protein MPER_08006, partial [Moniliophthora perniciosa FA553]
LFGLEEVKNTLVGDAVIRGVSGGQRKRVSLAEVLAARPKMVSWDNSTRGLDSSTALEFVQNLRTMTNAYRMTTIAALYQPGEPLYKLFDKVCVIYEGKMAYFGPASEARAYFISMGYEPANRQSTADFLVAVTDPTGRITRADLQLTAIPPVEGDLQGKRKSRARPSYKEELSLPGLHKYASQGGDVEKTADVERKLAVYVLEFFASDIQLRVDLVSHHLSSFVFNALIMGSVFLKTPENTSAYFSRGGVLFFALLFAAFVAMAEIPALFSQRPIVLRHMRYALHHPFIDQAALFLVDLPIIFLQLGVFVAVLYNMRSNPI